MINFFKFFQEYNWTIVLISSLITFLSLTFILDGFKFSDIKLIRYSQYSMFGCILIGLYIFFIAVPIYCTGNDPNDEIVSTTINMSKEGLTIVGEGLKSLGDGRLVVVLE
jgi:hypothetical protein